MLNGQTKATKNRNSGSTLIVVVVMAAVTALLLSAVATSVLSANAVSQQNEEANQAYFTARSAVNTMVNYVTDSANASKLSAFIPQSVSATIPSNTGNLQWTQMKDDSGKNMGWYYVVIKRIDSNTIRITGTASYPNQNHGATRTVSRYLVKSDAQLTQAYSNLLYSNSAVGTTFGQSNFNGNITTIGALTIGNGTSITGTITSNGKITVSNNATGITGITAIGDLDVSNSGTITNGDVHVTGNISISDNSAINGSVYANGSLTMSGSTRITKNVAIGGNATFSGTPKIGGNLTVGGTYPDTAPVAVSGTNTKNASVAPVVITAPKTITQTISIPTATTDPNLYAPPVFENVTIPNQWDGRYKTATISQDCTFNSNDSVIGGVTFGYSPTLTIDTSSADVSLLVTQNSTLSNISLIVAGNHNLYIYLANNVSLTIGANVYFGPSDKSASPKVYIMGNGTSALSLTNDSNMNACVYIPNGSFSASGSNYVESQKFRGSIVTTTISVDSNIVMDYLQSDVTASVPLEAAFSSWIPGDWTQNGQWGN